LVENEELLLRNTYLNAQMGPIALYQFDQLEQKQLNNRLKWIDNDNPNNLRTNASEDDLIFKHNPEPVVSHKIPTDTKSIIKPEGKSQEPASKHIDFYKANEQALQDAAAYTQDFSESHAQEAIPQANTISGGVNYPTEHAENAKGT
jgi:hypothetical protein